MSGFPWTSNGWDGEPVNATADGSEIVYRVYDTSAGAVSKLWGRFFFAPKVAGTNISYMTADMIERELNAALWGNRFEFIARFQLVKGADYQIGNIAQGDYSEKDHSLDQVFQAQSFITPSGLFSQLFIDDPKTKVRLLGSTPLKQGNFSRQRSDAWH